MDRDQDRPAGLLRVGKGLGVECRDGLRQRRRMVKAPATSEAIRIDRRVSMVVFSLLIWEVRLKAAMLRASPLIRSHHLVRSSIGKG